MIKQFLKKLNLFKIYIVFLFLLSSYYLASVYLLTVNNAMSEWVINYGGGFVRRGLIGELIFQFSNFFELKLRDLFLILQIFLYLVYYISIYWLLKDFKKNLIICLAIFSPVFFSFGLYELEALGRKEILMYILFFLNFYLFYKIKNINLNYIFTYFSLPILILSHESVIFYFTFYLFFFFILDEKKNIRFWILNILTILIIIGLSLLIYTNPHTAIDNAQMCKKLMEFSNETCGLAAAFTTANISKHINEVDWKFVDIKNYFFIFVFGYSAIFFLIYNSKLLIENFLTKYNLIYYFIICSLPGLILFLIAVDSGRWTSMMYHMIAITYFGMLKLNVFKLNYNSTIKYINVRSGSFLFYFLIFLLAFGWSPKAVYHESFGTFPAYRMIAKTHKFLNNFKQPNHFFKNFFLNNLTFSK